MTRLGDEGTEQYSLDFGLSPLDAFVSQLFGFESAKHANELHKKRVETKRDFILGSKASRSCRIRSNARAA